jgi:hypothetical protein
VSVFLTELAKKAAERWLALLVLPGILWVTALFVAWRLGQWPPLEVGRLRSWLAAQAGNPGSHSLATVLLAAVGLLSAAAGAGLVASALGAGVQRLWAANGWYPPLAWLARARQGRWDKATERLRAAIAIAANPAAHHYEADRATDRVRVAQERRSAIGPSRPARPTPIGDRFHATATRAKSLYGLDLDLAWPRLWAVLPDSMRTDLTASGDAYAAAARLTAWGLLYALLVVFCWPAFVVGLVVMGCGWVQGRGAGGVLADLTDTAVDLYTGDLAERLGLPAARPLTAATGEEIIRILRGS